MYTSWQQRERFDVLGPHDGEMTAVDSGDLDNPQSFGRCDDRCVDSSQWQVPVAGNQFGDAEPVGCCHGFDGERAHCQVAEEAHLGSGAQAGAEQVDHFGDDEGRDDQRTRMGLQEIQRCLVVSIVSIDVGVQRSGVDEQRGYGATSAAKISSIRSEMSLRPLRPAPAAPKVRRPPDSPR